MLASDGKLKYKFVFWDVDCVKLIGKSALQMKLDLMEVFSIWLICKLDNYRVNNIYCFNHLDWRF